MKTKTNSMT